jgi:SAM-dependent methyltransferase
VRDAGLVTGAARLTPLGGKLAYHLFQYRRQEANAGIDRWLGPAAHDPDGRVLDLGCGAGQWMLSAAGNLAARCVGLDIDLESLALGWRLARRDHKNVLFVCSTADALPFPDDYFSHAVCRVALNYMHQRRALAALRRVLRPGAVLYCRVEGPGHDLHLIAGAVASPRLTGRVRDLGRGLLLALTGWQPAPGSRFAGGRAFGTLSRLRKTLGPGWEVLHTKVLARFGGLPRSFELAARKT